MSGNEELFFMSLQFEGGQTEQILTYSALRYAVSFSYVS